MCWYQIRSMIWWGEVARWFLSFHCCYQFLPWLLGKGTPLQKNTSSCTSNMHAVKARSTFGLTQNSRPWQQYPKLVMIHKPSSKRSQNQLLTTKVHDNSFPFQTSLTIGYLSFMNKNRVCNCLFVHPFEITLLLTNLSSCSWMNWSKNSAFLFDLSTPTCAHRHCCADERQPFTEEVWNELSVTDLHLRKSWKRVHNNNLPRQREDRSFQKRSAILKPLNQTPIATVWHQHSAIMYSVVSAVDIYLPQEHIPNFITIWHIQPSENPQSNTISEPVEKSL